MTQHGQVQFVCDRHAVRLAEKDDFLARGVEKLEARTSPFQFHGLAVLLNQLFILSLRPRLIHRQHGGGLCRPAILLPKYPHV